MKKPAKAAKKPQKKAAPKKRGAGGGVLGCCTVTGIGRDKDFEHVTESRCQELADELGGNPHWVPGECA